MLNGLKDSKSSLLTAFVALIISLLLTTQANAQKQHNADCVRSRLTAKQELGKRIFFDERLSSPRGMSCATCHSPNAGFADPRNDLPVSRGAVNGLFGNRNAPSVTYAAYSPTLHYDSTPRPGTMGGMYVGGLFWDGRAADLKEQAKAPFLNPVEMNNGSAMAVVLKVRDSSYAGLFRQAFGSQAFRDVTTAFNCIAEAIAEYEKSSEVCPFNSKYDQYVAGIATLTDKEERGLILFSGKAKCMNCHSMDTSLMGKALFTHFGHQNTGVPKNPDNPFYGIPSIFNPDGDAYVDMGLGGFLGMAMENGKFKIPSLRNCAVTAPYMHNGCFSTLKEVIHFNNTRDVATWGGVAYWPLSEVAMNVHRHMPPMDGTFGRLGLTSSEENDIVAFLQTLTDGYNAN